MTNVFEHPWLGGLFGDDEASAIWSPERQMRHMLAFEKAWAQALGHVGIVPSDIAHAAAKAIGGFAPDLPALRRGSARDGLPVPALIVQLKAAAGANAHAVHRGATSQDVIDTALALTLREMSDLFTARIERLSQGLGDLTKRFGDNALMGRTRMQAALPIAAADRIVIWQMPLADHLRRLEQVRDRVELLQFGGAAGNRAATGGKSFAIAEFLADALHLGNPPRSWHARRDGIAEYAGHLSLITGTLGKMGQDICLMAQQGVDEIDLADGGGSSAMPHKQNPILAELLVTLARFNAVQVSGIHHALVHEQERSGAAWSLEWMIVPQMALATARSLEAASELCRQIVRVGRSNDGSNHQ
ncbi:3-carboxy-cis,cis-muconate cycloisomerase [Defluviimonas aquaemixtae]|uniref:3-carboxy-cis,cis-muconate cycloisomerase n=1 Tax=Albidovulum aquaemixtae TaxID=1542388 RepID=A0A2R8BNQ2_9RHOB|nr:3-carboxy-cis,cis-muconate cycloisomerase [Defluviimonas aquaemixtae]SPH25056.1 3-carboxy-cis,cis-muconate cycloisomerase [Defluviimonas aquaemixtae]